MKREKKIASLMDETIKKEHMMFPHLRETFYLAGVQYNDIRPSRTAMLEKIKKLSVTAIESMEVKGENV